MNKKALMLTTLLALVMLTTSLMGTVQAGAPRRWGNKHFIKADGPIIDLMPPLPEPEITRGGTPGNKYTEVFGSINGANFYVLIPDKWKNPLGDGMLVVLCRSAGYVEDPRTSLEDYPFALALVEDGIAVAASNYGSMFVNASTGAVRTHELALYVVNKYHVKGKVFLCGTSLGGAVALLLGEQYPDIYSGVLDINGVKDTLYLYYTAVNYLITHPPDPVDPFLFFFFSMLAASGPPDPVDVQNNSPNFHAEISIPVISIVHYADQIIHPIQTEWYHANVSDPDLHIVVEVTINSPGPYPPMPPLPPMSSWYGHFDPINYMARAVYFPYLVEWSNGDIGTGDIPPVFP